MKKVLFLSLLLVGLYACNKTNEEEEPDVVPKIEIDGAAQVVLPITGTGSFSFTTNVAWTAFVKDLDGTESSWCFISPAQGDKGTNRITITTDENASPYDQLSAIITVVAANGNGSVSKDIEVTWTADHLLSFSEKSITPLPKGEIIGLVLQSTLEYEIEIFPESATSWLKPVESSKGLVEDSLYFEVLTNEESGTREAKIIAKSKTQIQGSYLADTVEVSQDVYSVLAFSEKSVKPSSKGEIIGLALQSTTEYEIEITPESALTWIIPVEDKALVEDSLYFEVLANGENSVRTAKITAKSKTQIQGSYLSDEVEVSQNSVCVFTLEDSGWDIYAGGAYRYGPSIIINDDGSIDAWFAAPGAAYGKNHELYNTNGATTPEGIVGDKTVAQKFTADIPFWGVSVTSPNWNGNTEMTWAGFDNFAYIFKNEMFLASLKNTFLYTIGTVPLTLVVSLFLAIVLNQKIKGKNFFRTVSFFPYVGSLVAITAVWNMLFNPSMGPINEILMRLGVENPPRWIADNDWAMFTIVLFSVWKYMGYYMVIYLAGLQGINTELYEAASIDGVNTWQKFWYVTLPQLKNTTFFILIMLTIQCSKVYDIVYMLAGAGSGALSEATTVLVYEIYNSAFRYWRLGVASAEALVLFAIVLVVTIVQFKLDKD